MHDLAVGRPVDDDALQAGLEILLEGTALGPETLARLLLLPLGKFSHCAGGNVFFVAELD